VKHASRPLEKPFACLLRFDAFILCVWQFQAGANDLRGYLPRIPCTATMPSGLVSAKFTRTYAPWAGLLLSIFVPFVVWIVQDRQNQHSQHEQRIARVFDISKEYRATFLDVNLQFSDEWRTYTQASIHKLPEAEVVKRYPELVSRFLDSPETRQHYETLLFFYDSLGECVRSELCDFDSANAMFGDDVLTLYDNMYPDLLSRRQTGSEANGIFDFIARKKAAQRR
jgi:hypothetical protein